jgi:N6-L-threonylcarbamoyladenine synthase
MKILGIETSCDETAAAVVENGTRVLSNVIASQIPLHQQTGGVVPEVAAREHVVKIVPVVEEALAAAGKTLGIAHFSFDDIDAIAVTQGPGLLSSLVIGVTAASTLAVATGKPLIPVNHIAGHIYANWLDERAEDPVKFPLVVMTVSGGHNELVYMKSHASFKLIGETLDDAAGEAFDKVARLLGLGYPGGPQVSRAALAGNARRYNLPQAYLSAESYDFSFSGLKTAVLNLCQREHKAQGTLSQEFIADCAASFQEAVCGVLSDKLLRASQEYKVREVHLAGGVSANKRLREIVTQKIDQKYFYKNAGTRSQPLKKIPLTHVPRLRYAANISYCTDNAAMIASTAFFHYKKDAKLYPANFLTKLTGKTSLGILADPSLRMY